MHDPVFDERKHLRLATDEEGRLYSPQVREVMGERVPAEARPTAEAFAALTMASRMLRLQMERWCEKAGLSETRLGVMFMLRHFEAGVPLGTLAARLRVSPRNVTGLIDHLERDGLVRRVPDPADRRSVLAQLTEPGRERIEALWDGTVAYQRQLMAGFTADELAQLRHLCLTVVQRLDALDKLRGGSS